MLPDGRHRQSSRGGAVSEGAGFRTLREHPEARHPGLLAERAPAERCSPLFGALRALGSGVTPPEAPSDLVPRTPPRPVFLIEAGHGQGGEELNSLYYVVRGAAEGPTRPNLDAPPHRRTALFSAAPSTWARSRRILRPLPPARRLRRLACVNTAHAITFLFADVEGSTGLQEDPRLDYPAVIGTVRRLLREATSGHEGEEADSVGDEFVAVFADPVRAAEAAIAAQRAFRDEEWPTTVTVRVRIGLHTGTPALGEEGYTGIDVVRASRIANAGHGGQIVSSAEAATELDDLSLRELGEFRLPGLSEPERIYQLQADDLPRDFPPLRNTVSTFGAGIRVVLADDSVLLREGLARLLGESASRWCAQAGDGEELLLEGEGAAQARHGHRRHPYAARAPRRRARAAG